MSFIPRKALGAVLAAAIAVTPTIAATAETPSTSSSEPRHNISALLSEASKLPDSPLTPTSTSSSSSTPTAPTSITSADEAARARALLDRYYAISAEAQAANQPVVKKDGSLIDKPATPSRSAPAKRIAATDAFETVKITKEAGAVHKKYVICGGGTAAWAAIDAILEQDPEKANDILLITDELNLPYNRTMLSKELWVPDNSSPSGHVPRESIEYAYRHSNGLTKVPVAHGVRVTRLDADEKTVELSNGGIVHYDKVLLATGGQPKPASFASASFNAHDVRDKVSVFRTLADFELAREVAETGDGVVVVGGGFLGTELAIALAGTTPNVSLVIAEAGVLYRVLPRYMCEFLARRISEIGVKVIRSAVVTDTKLEKTPDGEREQLRVSVLSSEEEEVVGGIVLVAAGIEPETDLARGAGLELDAVRGGVMVNDFMMAEPDVFAAGDMASFHDRALGRRRVEHWDHAVVTGKIAGSNMTGMRERYGLQSMFWSDLSNIGVNITAVGLVDSRLETVAVWNTSMPCETDVPAANDLLSGVVYYLSPEREIVGVVLWNAEKGSGALRRARALVDAKTSVHDLSDRLLGDLVKLPDGSFRMTVRTRAL